MHIAVAICILQRNMGYKLRFNLPNIFQKISHLIRFLAQPPCEQTLTLGQQMHPKVRDANAPKSQDSEGTLTGQGKKLSWHCCASGRKKDMATHIAHQYTCVKICFSLAPIETQLVNL